MRSLSNLGVGLAILSSLLFLALIAELYYIFFLKKRRSNSISRPNFTTFSSKYFTPFLCFKHSNLDQTDSSLNPHANPIEDPIELTSKDTLWKPAINVDESIDVELMRLHSLSGPPRFLFTINEETREDLESDDGRSRGGRSRKGSRGRSLGDLLHCSETPLMTPLMTPLSSPPLLGAQNLANLSSFKQVGFNPLFESAYSPPPKFKFLKDAEEKLQRSLMDGSRCRGNGDEYITIVVGKSRENGQVTPLPPSPLSIKTEK